MISKIYLLCYVLTILAVHVSRAESIVEYNPKPYNVPVYVNPNANSYTQTQRLAEAPNNVGLPLIAKLYPAGLPVVPQLPQTAHSTGVKLKSLPPTAFLLRPDPLSQVITIQTRETNNQLNKGAENVTSTTTNDNFKQAIDPSVTLSNSTVINDSHQAKPRSSDNIESAEEFDYLTKAANPIDQIESKFGSMMKKVGKGFKHTMEKIDTTLWPSHAQNRTLQHEHANKFTPYQIGWAKNSENTNNNYDSKDKEDSISDIMNYYLKMVQANQNSQIPQDKLQENLADGLKSVLEQFQKSVSESSLLKNDQPFNPKNNEGYYNNRNGPSEYSQSNQFDPNKFWNSAAAKLADNIVDTVTKTGHSKNNPTEYDERLKEVNKLWNKASDLSSNIVDAANYYGKTGQTQEFDQKNYPISKMWNSAAELANQAIDTVGNSGKSNNGPMEYDNRSRPNNFWDKIENFGGNIADSVRNQGNVANQPSEYSQGNNPMDKIWNTASKFADNISGFTTNYGKSENGLSGYDQNKIPDNLWRKAFDLSGNIVNQVSNPTSSQGYYSNYYPDQKAWNSIPNSSGKGASPEMYSDYYYGNGPMPNYYSPNYGNGYYQGGSPAGAIWNSATDLAHNIAGYVNGDGYYKNSNPTGVDPNLSRNYRQQPAMNSGYMVPAADITQSAINLAQNIANRNPGQIVQSSLNLGTGISKANSGFLRTPFFKRSPQIDNIWNSANDLADSIASTGMNSGKVGSGQMLGSAGKIWNAANNLASNIGQSNNILGSSKLSEYSKPADSIWNSATDLASNIAKSITNPQKLNGDNIVGSTNGESSLLKGDNAIGSIWKSANNLANNIAKSSYSLGDLGGRQILGSNKSPGLITNSAVDLANKITNDAIKTSNIQTSRLLGVTNPTAKLLNPAANIAPSIVKTALNPGWISNTPLLGIPNSPLTIGNPTVNAASNIVKTALSPGLYGTSPLLSLANPAVVNPAIKVASNIVKSAVSPVYLGKPPILQPYAPTYAGGYFPRNSQLTPNLLNPVPYPKIPTLYGKGLYPNILPLGIM